jgi:CheY-like chemotaxis protein
LIDNAIKFTLHGSVELTCHISENKLRFFVTDTGIGIPGDLINAVFEPFRQVETGICRNYGGTGLGLPIVKAFTELLKGTIQVESEINKGTKVIIELPLIQTKHVNIKETPGTEDIQTGTLLIAEDEMSNYQYLLEILEETGLKIIHAQNGKQAVETCLKDESVSLVLMDIKMPVMDGHEAATSIKAARPGLPIIAQTAYALSHEIEKYKAVFDDYITKPIDEKELLKMIKKHY